ncbi:MAG: hypothetical protein AAGA21_12325 [Pseudomonadota bacterium]
MNITPSQNTLQAFGSSLNSAASATQVRQPVAAEQIERPAPNTTQRVDAAPRAEAPARPDVNGGTPVQETAQNERPGSRLNLLV